MADPKVLDQPWRIWASVAIGGILLTGVLLGIVVIPIVQGRGAGLDAFAAICRAIGVLPGSPAQPQPVNRTPPSPVSQVVWTPQVLQVLAQASTERGRAKVLEVCAPCHGEQGVSTDPATPNLNGQSGAAIYKQLHDYRTGSRVNETMTPIAQSVEESDIADLAAYFAGQRKRNPNPSTMSGRTPEIVQLVELGDPKRGLPPCLVPSARFRRPHRSADSGRAEPRLSRAAAADVCKRRATERRLCAHEDHRGEADARRDQRLGALLLGRLQVTLRAAVAQTASLCGIRPTRPSQSLFESD